MALGIKNWFKKTFEPFFDPAGKDTAERHASESVKQAEKFLPKHIKDMAPADLAREINRLNQPNKWAITRMAAQGMPKQNHVGGNTYPPNYTSEKRLKRIKSQIEKGMIQVTVDKPYQSSKTPEWLEKNKPVVTEEKVNEGNSQVVQ